MSFREKFEWILLPATLIVWGWYFSKVAAALPTGESLVGPFIWAAAASLLVVFAALLAALAITPKGQRISDDEREVGIGGRGMLAGYGALSIFVLAAAWSLTGPLQDLDLGPVEVVVPNMLVLTLVAAEVVRSLANLIQFRMLR